MYFGWEDPFFVLSENLINADRVISCANTANIVMLLVRCHVLKAYWMESETLATQLASVSDQLNLMLLCAVSLPTD